MIIVEKITDNFARLEIDGDFTDVELSLIKNTAKEGDVLDFCDGFYYVNATKTAARREEMRSLSDSMWN